MINSRVWLLGQRRGVRLWDRRIGRVEAVLVYSGGQGDEQVGVQHHQQGDEQEPAQPGRRLVGCGSLHGISPLIRVLGVLCCPAVEDLFCTDLKNRMAQFNMPLHGAARLVSIRIESDYRRLASPLP